MSSITNYTNQPARAKVAPGKTLNKGGYMVPADTTNVKLQKIFNSDKVSKPTSQPVTIDYPNGHYKKIDGEWKQVVSETFVPATPKEKQDLWNKLLKD